MEPILLKGVAERNGDILTFQIGPQVGGVGLTMSRSAGGESVITGGGIWPSIEKAQQIAAATVSRLLGPDCKAVWRLL
ncbi:hypothetical protein GCM10022270_13490 [Terriglobus aquaticus]